VIIWLFVARLIIGGAEQFGAPELSKHVAGGMLAIMAGLFLIDGRLARATTMFSAGLLIWISAAGLSVLGARVPDASAASTLCIVLAFYLFFANILWTRFNGAKGLADLDRMFRAFLIIGLVFCAAQLVSGSGFVDPGKPDMRRVYGADVHPVSFGLQVVVAMASIAAIAIWRGKPAPYLLLVLGLCALYLTYARTAWGVMALLVILFGLLSKKWATRLGVIGAAGAGVLALALYSDRFADLVSLPYFLHQFDFLNPVFDHRLIDNSLSWRVMNWAFGLQQALQAVWFGHGPGQSAVVSLFQLEMHNIFLEAFFELGLLGIFAVAVTVLGVWRFHRKASNATDPALRRANALIHGLGVGLFISVVVSTSLVDQLTTVMLYLMALRAAAIVNVAPR
jgi:O-antigen ligase